MLGYGIEADNPEIVEISFEVIDLLERADSLYNILDYSKAFF